MVKIAQDSMRARVPAPAVSQEVETSLPSRYLAREPEVIGINVFNELVSAPGSTNNLFVRLRYPNGVLGPAQDLIVSNHAIAHRPGAPSPIASVLTIANSRQRGEAFIPENFRIYYARFERRTNPLTLTEMIQDPEILPTDNKMKAALVHYSALHRLMRRIDLVPARNEFSRIYDGAFFDDDGSNGKDDEETPDNPFTMSLGKNGEIYAQATKAVKKAGMWKQASNGSDFQSYMIAFGHNKCREPFEDMMVIYTRNCELAKLIRTYVGMVLFETKCRETVRERTIGVLSGIGLGHAIN